MPYAAIAVGAATPPKPASEDDLKDEFAFFDDLSPLPQLTRQDDDVFLERRTVSNIFDDDDDSLGHTFASRRGGAPPATAQRPSSALRRPLVSISLKSASLRRME
jgi:hypothetical protein